MAQAPRKRASWRDYVQAMAKLEKAKVLSDLPKIIVAAGASEYGLGRVAAVAKAVARNADAHISALEGSELDASRFLQLTEQTSLFEPTTLYLVRRAEGVKQLPQLLQNVKSVDRLANHLVFITKTEAIAAGLRTQLDRLGALVVPAVDPWPSEVLPIATKMAQDMKLSLSAEAIGLLVEASGSDLIKLDNELKKLLFVFDDKSQESPLSAKDIAPHLGMLREDDAFQLDTLLLQGRWSHAQALASGLLEHGEKPLALVGLLARHCRNALRVAELQKKGAGVQDLSFALRLPQFVLKDYAQYASRTPPQIFLKTLESCRAADQALKSSRMDEELLIAGIIDNLAHS